MLKNDNKEFYIITSVPQAKENKTLDVDITGQKTPRTLR
jgi:hypothetical protein